MMEEAFKQCAVPMRLDLLARLVVFGAVRIGSRDDAFRGESPSGGGTL